MIRPSGGWDFTLIDEIVRKCTNIFSVFNKAASGVRSGKPRLPLFLSAALLSLSFIAADPHAVVAADPHPEPRLDPDSMTVRSWGTDSGLPHNEIRAILQDADGYIWLGTPAGLVRFDGVNFAVFDRWNSPVLSENKITSLYEDIYQKLWVGTDGGGLYSINKGKWKKYGSAEGLASEHITAVTGDWQGNIWCGTELGLYRFDGDEVTVYGLDEGLPDAIITAAAVDELGRLWVGMMRGGLARFEGDLAEKFGYYEGLIEERVLSIVACGGGRILAGTMKGIFELKAGGNSFVLLPETEHFPTTVLSSGAGGSVLAGTMVEGLKVIRGGSLKDLFREDRLASSHMLSILCDRDGFIWAGTKSKGLQQLREKKAGSTAVAEGFPAGAVYSPAEDRDGALWVGSENSGLWKVAGRRAAGHLDKESGLSGNIVRAVIIDDRDRLWAGTKDAGLTVITGDRTLPLSGEAARSILHMGSAEGLLSDNITALLQDRTGTVWVGTDRGLNFFSSGAVGRPGNSVIFGNQAVQALHESSEGVLYAGTKDGLWILSGAVFEKAAGDSGGSKFDVISILEDSSGRVWAGTKGDGLRSVSGGRISSCTSRDGLPGDFIYSIIETPPGRLWISCEAGVFTIQADSLSSGIDGGSGILSAFLFDDSDGMPSKRCSGLCSPAVLVTGGGGICYPTAAGLALFDAKAGIMPGKRPRVVIEEILIDGKPLQIDPRENTHILSHGAGRIEIRFTAFDYADPGKVRFLYRLKGYDREAITVGPGAERIAVYSGLKPGEYLFELRAVGNGGVWSEEKEPLVFEVRPPFYRRAGFIILSASAVLLAAAGALAGAKYRKNLKKKNKYSTSYINSERMDEAFEKLTALIEEEAVYLDPDLTLKKLAKRLGIHYNHLSRIINERFSVSFSHFINNYRIEEAKKRLVSEKYSNRNISEIIYDVGFYSKSTFNTAFKRFTGMSPSEFRKKNSRN
ncbi:MAG: helix-turn-helix domain-containing protein [Candidatus Krumholzibacteriota bacterium]|nr:helix-turn-helix domain-containing protein [Candidatus Krumholzibacteriota bacterium]